MPIRSWSSVSQSEPARFIFVYRFTSVHRLESPRFAARSIPQLFGPVSSPPRTDVHLPSSVSIQILPSTLCLCPPSSTILLTLDGFHQLFSFLFFAELIPFFPPPIRHPQTSSLPYFLLTFVPISPIIFVVIPGQSIEVMISTAAHSPPGGSAQISRSASPLSAATAEDLVVALYDFHPTPPSINRCLSFKAGQVIRVVNRDKSGWWDGEMISTSNDKLSPPQSHPHPFNRGWFPSNYVSSIPNTNKATFELHQRKAFTRQPSVASLASVPSTSNDIFLDSPAFSSTSTLPDATPTFFHGINENDPSLNGRHLSPERGHLLPVWEPIVRAIRVLHSEVEHNTILTVQPATTNIISAVRGVLDSTGCLGRDSTFLRLYPSLSRERKLVLSALAALVDRVRKITAPGSLPADSSDAILTDADQSSLYQRRRVILQLADKVLSHVRRFLEVAQQCGITPTSPSSGEGSSISRVLNTQRSMSLRTPALSRDPPRSIRSSKSVGTLSRPCYDSSDDPPSIQFGKVASVIQHHRLESSNSASSSSYPATTTPATFSSTQILTLVDKSHDQVLSAVAVFIGHAHIHSSSAHPASHAHLIDMTRDVIENVCEMLVLVECISKNSQVRSQQVLRQDSTLAEAREALYVSTTRLVTAARVATSGSTDESAVPNDEEDEGDSLLTAATAVLRAANCCMDAVSQCLSCIDPIHGEFQVPSRRPPVKSSLGENSYSAAIEPSYHHSTAETFSRNTHHRLSILGRKASNLALTRNSIESENSGWSAVSQDWQRSLKPKNLPIATSKSSDGGSPHSRESHLAARGTLANKSPNLSFMSPSLSTLSSFDGIEFLRPTTSRANSSDGRYSRESSPATSTSISYPEDEGRLTSVVPSKSLPQGRSQSPLQAPIQLGSQQNPDSWQKELLLNNEGQVIGGTLRGLVGRMTSHDTPVEATFFHSFFMTFRLFTTSVELANALIARFGLTFLSPGLTNEHEPPAHVSKVTPIRLRVYNVMKSWLELHWRIDSDEIALSAISAWAGSQLSAALPVPAERLLELIKKRMKEGNLGIQSSAIQTRIKANKILGGGEETFGKLPCPPPIISKALMTQLRMNGSGSTMVQLLDFDPTELARQITLIEFKLYDAIKPEEIIGQLFNKKPGSAVNVRAMSAMSTKMTGWFTETILNEDDIRKRTQTIKFLIKLGSKLREIQNYNALMSVMSALNSSTILRLKRTWEGVGNKARALLDVLNQAVSHQRNYAEYRATLRSAHTPCIPFLGVYLTDMTFCHEGNPTHRSSPDLPGVKLINFDKYQKMTKIMSEIERFQIPFNFTEVPQVVSYIRFSMENLVYQASAENLYQRSLVIEPRESSHPTVHP